MEKLVTDTLIRREVHCDICDATLPFIIECYGCGKDLCVNCCALTFSETDPFSGEYLHDDTENLCAKCAEISTHYLSMAKAFRDLAESRTRELKAEFLSRCRVDNADAI